MLKQIKAWLLMPPTAFIMEQGHRRYITATVPFHYQVNHHDR